MKRLRHNGRPGGAAQAETAAPEQASAVPVPRATTQVSKPTNTKRNVHAAQDTTAANKRKRRSDEGNSTVSNTESDHAAQKKRRIRRNDPPSPASLESDSQLETSDESQSKYETAPQFPISKESQTEDDDTLVPLTTQGEEETEENGSVDALEAWIQKRIDSGRNGDHILQALSCTSMNAELADRVLDLLAKGKGIPKDIPGVWTEEDDDALTGQDGRAMERVMKKHGSELFDERWEFLEQSARATQLVAEGGK